MVGYGIIGHPVMRTWYRDIYKKMEREVLEMTKCVSRHEERDRRLSQAREELLEDIIRILQADSNVIGIFLGGSLGKRNPDPYSDIDLRIVVEDGMLDRYIARKQTMMSEFGDVLFFEVSILGLRLPSLIMLVSLKSICSYTRSRTCILRCGFRVSR